MKQILLQIKKHQETPCKFYYKFENVTNQNAQQVICYVLNISLLYSQTI